MQSDQLAFQSDFSTRLFGVPESPERVKEEQPSVHLLSLYECESGIVIAQEAVQSKENEITAAGAFLHPLLVKGRIISADAMHTQKKWCAAVQASGGYYLFTVKDNQPTFQKTLQKATKKPIICREVIEGKANERQPLCLVDA